MDTKFLDFAKRSGKKELLYPLLVIAATAAIISSAFGIALMTGLVPRPYLHASGPAFPPQSSMPVFADPAI